VGCYERIIFYYFRAQDDVYVGRKRYGFGYLSLPAVFLIDGIGRRVI
jgi:hypothetical protein